MQFPKSKLLSIFIILIFLIPAVNAADSIENVLSNNRLEIFDLSRKKADEESSILEKDWINQVIFKLTKEYGEEYDTLKSTVSISQPIFKSGGIYKAIKYARASKKYAHLDIKLQKKAMIKDAVSLLFQIKRQDITINKQKLLIKNSDIDVERKKEQVLNGLIDASFLDNAILDSNTKKNSLLDLNFEKHKLLNDFNNLSNAAYNTVDLPILSIIDKNHFLRKNLNVLKITADIEKKYQYKGISVAKYLPTLNVTYDYFNYHDNGGSSSITNDSGSTYGFNIIIPLDAQVYNDIESSKLDYLKAKVELQNIILEEKNFLKLKLEKLKMYDSKINLAKNDFNLYTSLLEDLAISFEAGITAEADVNIMKNSKEIKSLDIEIFGINKQIYNNFSELALYLPRALQIGFLSPFPSNWLKKGVEVGTIGNILAGLEMIIWYFVLLGFIYITYKNPSVIKPLSVVFLISILLIPAYSMTSWKSLSFA